MNIRRYRRIYHNRNAAYQIMETLISVGICVSLLIVFYTSTINVYNVYDVPDIDLQAKSIGILDVFINSPGQGVTYSSSWEDDPANVSSLGLGTFSTVEYGILKITSEGESIIYSRHSFSNNIGVAETCFLDGTKVLMADGTYKNIENVTVGDIVISYCEETDKLVTSRVIQTFYHSPEEMMTDYYLLINNVLKVTSDHRFYSNGKWVDAGDLEINDTLFHPLSEHTIHSIEKIYEKRPVYDLKVAVYHNYFVMMNKADVLVHNNDIHAEFTWFDSDGLGSGTYIFFNASDSYIINPDGEVWYTWWWDWNGTESDDNHSTTDQTWECTYIDDDSPYLVRLKVNDSSSSDYRIYTVQANTFQIPDIEPGTETEIDIFPGIDGETLGAYDERYFVIFTDLSTELGDDYYLFEVKEKINSPSNILDLEKVLNMPNIDYNKAKSALGLNNSKVNFYSFNITISDVSGEICTYGPSYKNANIVVSNKRKVLIYYKPQIDGQGDIIRPYYGNGQITVRVFL